jgi:predicted DNA-binding transcriptional regulator
MADFAKNMVSLITFVFFMFGTVLTGFGIFQASELSDKTMEEKYIIPSQVLNGLTVMFLLYLTSTSSFSASYKLLIIVLLVGGMILEIYLTSYADRKPESIAAYVFVTLNFLIRGFFLIDLIQGEWVSPIVQTVRPAQSVVKDTIVKPLQDAIKEVTRAEPEEKISSDDIGQYKDKFRAIVKEIKSKNPDFDNMSIVRDAWPVIDEAAKAGEFTNIHLKEALDKVKNKDGTPVTGVTVGGRKSRS